MDELDRILLRMRDALDKFEEDIKALHNSDVVLSKQKKVDELSDTLERKEILIQAKDNEIKDLHDKVSKSLDIEEVKATIEKEQEKIQMREKFLSAKMEELKLREKGIIADEIEDRDEERALEIKQEKVKTGNVRLDDLLLGGIPFGSNVLIFGPPFIGKEVSMRTFIADGLKKGIPAIVTLTDQSISQFREEMEYVLSGYIQYEERGLIKYVSAYTEIEPDKQNVIQTNGDDLKGLLEAITKYADELDVDNVYYRFILESISTSIGYNETVNTFKFLHMLTRRNKRNKAVSFHSIDAGMHTETDMQMLGHMMDGMLEFKVESLKTYLAVKGICDVQSRAWVRYSHTKRGLNIGSFSLDHIKDGS